MKLLCHIIAGLLSISCCLAIAIFVFGMTICEWRGLTWNERKHWLNGLWKRQ